MESDVWVVTWKFDYRTVAIDLDTEELAQNIAVRLGEDPRRTEVMVFARQFEVDPVRMAEVKERVWRAMQSHALGSAMREAVG